MPVPRFNWDVVARIERLPVDTWVRFNDVTGDMSIMDKMHSANGPNTDGWRLLKQFDNLFWFCVAQSSNQCGNPSFTLFSATSVTTGTWYHVAVTKNSGTMSLYVNGVLENTISTPSFVDTNSTDLLLGGNISEGAYLNGLIWSVPVQEVRQIRFGSETRVFDADAILGLSLR